MSAALPSLDLIEREVRAERIAHIRHHDAVDTKAGVVLVAAGVLTAIATQPVSTPRYPGIALAVLAALAALSALVPQHFPTWQTSALRRYLRAEEEFTRLTMLDTTIDMIQDLKRRLAWKVLMLRVAVYLLGGSILATALGTIWI